MKKKITIITFIMLIVLVAAIPITYAVWQVSLSRQDDVEKATYSLTLKRGETTLATYSDLEYNAVVKLEERENDGISFFKGWSSDPTGVSPAPSRTYDFKVKDVANGSTTSFTMYAIYTDEVPTGYVRIDLYQKDALTPYAYHFVKTSGKFDLFNLTTDGVSSILSFTGEDSYYCANDKGVYGYYTDLGCNYYFDFSKSQFTEAVTSTNNIISLTVSVFSYSIVFDANSSEGITGSMSALNMSYGTSKSLTTNGYTRDGYHFVSWNTSPDGSGTTYTNGQSVSNLTKIIGDTVYLYAQWEPNA